MRSLTQKPVPWFRCALCAVIGLCLQFTLGATEEIFYGGLHRTQLQATTPAFEVADTFPPNVDYAQGVSARGMIWFSVDEDTVVKASAFTHWVRVTIEKYDPTNTLISTETNVLFTVSFDPAEGVSYNYGHVHEFPDVHRFKVTVTSKSASFPGFLRLEGKIIINRKYDFDCDATPLLIQKSHSDLLDNSTHSLRVGWQKQVGAEEYDLEWAFYDTLSPTITAAGGSEADFDFVFRNNATRVTTSQTWYSIPIIYPKGRIYWRVRGVRYAVSGRQQGLWSSRKSSPTTLTIRKEWYWVSPHEQGLNWQAQNVFAEEGKKSQSITYFDGSMRNRQSMSRSDAINMTIASEVVYDSIGRAVLQVMPAPVSTGTGVDDWLRGLQYYATYSAAQGKTSYAAVDVNFDSASCDLASLNPAAKMDTTGSAAGRYYSSANPLRDRFLNQYTPASEGYPFAVTEYMPDPTGRVRRQGGVGPTFQIGSGHETKYYYAKPSDQSELDRLFGNEAGHRDHYFKNAVVDPNGQISISYVDAHGRTVATALAGAKPDNLEQLSSFVVPSRQWVDLLSNIREGTALRSTHSLLVTSSCGPDTFQYTFYPGLQLTIDSCLSMPRCYDCKYDLEIQVVDECGGLVVSFEKSNFTQGEFDTTCEALPDTILRRFMVGALAVGQYQVTKTLRVNESALNYYADDYLDHLTCLPSIDSLAGLYLGDTTCVKTCEECHDRLGTLEDFREAYLDGIEDPGAGDMANADTAYYRAKRECALLCDESDISDCGVMYQMMLTDVMPGGQYATYGTTTVSYGGTELDVFGASTDETSVFWKETGAARYPYQEVSDIELYKDEFGNVDYVLLPDSTPVRVDHLGINEFISYFKPSWAKTLVKAHPEWCAYLCCKEMSGTSNFDSLLTTTTTYAQAVANGFFPIDSLIAQDPFFDDNPDLLEEMLITWHAYIITSPTSCSDSISLTEILTSIIYCEGELPCVVPDTCLHDNNLFWLVYQRQYLSQRARLKWEKIRNDECPPVGDPDDAFCKLQSEMCFGKPTCMGDPNPYEEKVSRTFYYPAPPKSDMEAQDSLYAMVETVESELGDVCGTTCASNAEQWIEKLKATCTTVQTATSIDLAELHDRFVEVCMGGCDLANPFGALSVDAVPTPTYGDSDIQDAITGVFPSLDGCDPGCSAKLIDFPGPFGTSQYVAPGLVVTNNDPCACERLTSLAACWGGIGSPNLLYQINKSSDVHITQEQLEHLSASCGTDCKYIGEPVTVPPILECGKCKTHEQVKSAWDTFKDSGCIGGTIDVAEQPLVVGHLNQLLGLNRTFAEYQAFVALSDSLDCRFLCPVSRFQPVPLDTACISDEQREAAFTLANLTYQNLLDSMRRVFVRNYLGKCLGSELVEAFNTSICQAEYHYTLYYYDQAGNLVRTVPPNGVHKLTSSADLAAVKAHRANPANAPKYPPHDFVTRYWYNTLNQLERDSTPDRGDTDYWYDKLGRLVLSQNAKQDPYFDYSYSLYDPLGRVVETGRVRKTSMGVAIPGTIWDYSSFHTWLDLDADGPRREVTRTWYDEALPGIGTLIDAYFPDEQGPGSDGQANLRNRVATVTFEDTDDADPLTYDYATHYSYDIGGNVRRMVQDFPELGDVGHRFKRIAYDYDLVSGKVNRVWYQQDSVDQFIHHYVYDADNRLQFVETSRDGLLWERDANYEYYLHGPLARTELGERRVQGMDYAYTLQGWLKAMNSSTLATNNPNGVANFATNDMGRDGKSVNTAFGRNKLVARDVAAFTLNYYRGDYRMVNTSYLNEFEIRLPAAAPFNTASPGLYNGNIRHAVYTIAELKETNNWARPEGYAYKYDQLNRLVSQRAYDNPTLGGSVPEWKTTGSALAHFREDAAYDGNGNILSYLRHGNNSGNQVMDNLTYHYPSNGNQLGYIDDAQTTTSAYAGDLEDQSSGNYQYDQIGNLIQDTRDSISGITWTNAQKIGEVTKTDRTIGFRYNPMQQRVLKYVRASGSDSERRTYYVRDAQGNVLAVYKAWVRHSDGIAWDSVQLAEQHIYGSSRVGLSLPGVWLYPAVPANPHAPDTSRYAIFEGRKRYEVSNHLGNVLAVVTDRKRGRAASGSDIQWFEADLVSSQQYYPFGMLMPGHASDAALRRQYVLNGSDYRYGFNGKEGDDEVKGDDNQQDYGMRIYDPRGGRFLSVDPIAREFPWYTPYQFAGNDVIRCIDLDGAERALVINRYSDGKIQKTTIQIISNNNAVINLNAQGNGIRPLTLKDILVVNVGDIPDGLEPYVIKSQFSTDETTILNAGVDGGRTLRGDEGPDKLADIGGFSFPGSIPTGDNINSSQISVGEYDDVPVFQTQTVPVTKLISTNFPKQIIKDPIGILPTTGEVSPNYLNIQEFNKLRRAFNTATANNIASINVDIGMTLGDNFNINTLQSQIASSLSKVFKYKGEINVRITRVPNGGQGQGYVTVSSPGGVVNRQVTETVTQEVQVGTERVLTKQ